MKPALHLVLLAFAAAGCERTASGGDDPAPQPPEPVRMTNPVKVHFHMRRHVDDLRAVERLLVAGKLDEAKTRAYLLTKPVEDPGMAPWFAESARFVDAAKQLAAAPSLFEACRREARVAQMCAECHARTQQDIAFANVPLPADDPTPAARMARHQWAADRLWEGMVAGSLRPWRSGLDVLAATPLPFSTQPTAPKLAERLHQLARDGVAQVEDQSETLDSRARTYGEILVTCAGCHASRPQPRSAGARP